MLSKRMTLIGVTQPVSFRITTPKMEHFELILEMKQNDTQNRKELVCIDAKTKKPYHSGIFIWEEHKNDDGDVTRKLSFAIVQKEDGKKEKQSCFPNPEGVEAINRCAVYDNADDDKKPVRSVETQDQSTFVETKPVRSVETQDQSTFVETKKVMINRGILDADGNHTGMKKIGLSWNGLTITKVNPDTLASKAGIQDGWKLIVLKVDGKYIGDSKSDGDDQLCKSLIIQLMPNGGKDFEMTFEVPMSIQKCAPLGVSPAIKPLVGGGMIHPVGSRSSSAPTTQKTVDDNDMPPKLLEGNDDDEMVDDNDMPPELLEGNDDEMVDDRNILVTVCFKHHRRQDFGCTLEVYKTLTKDMHVMVEGDRGRDLGTVVEMKSEAVAKTKPNYKVIGPASTENIRYLDVVLRKEENDAAEEAQRIVEKCGLNLRIVATEYQFDKRKITVYYTSTDSKPQVKSCLPYCYKKWRCRVWFTRWSQTKPPPNAPRPMRRQEREALNQNKKERSPSSQGSGMSDNPQPSGVPFVPVMPFVPVIMDYGDMLYKNPSMTPLFVDVGVPYSG